MLAALLTGKARIAVLKPKVTSDCSITSQRIGAVTTLTPAVCEARAMVTEKYRKSPY